jgi:hypothetical protein
VLLDGPLASSHQLDKLLVHDTHDTAKLNEQERHIVAFPRQDPMIDLAYQLTQHCMRMMRERESQKVES